MAKRKIIKEMTIKLQNIPLEVVNGKVDANAVMQAILNASTDGEISVNLGGGMGGMGGMAPEMGAEPPMGMDDGMGGDEAGVAFNDDQPSSMAGGPPMGDEGGGEGPPSPPPHDDANEPPHDEAAEASPPPHDDANEPPHDEAAEHEEEGEEDEEKKGPPVDEDIKKMANLLTEDIRINNGFRFK